MELELVGGFGVVFILVLVLLVVFPPVPVVVGGWSPLEMYRALRNLKKPHAVKSRSFQCWMFCRDEFTYSGPRGASRSHEVS